MTLSTPQRRLFVVAFVVVAFVTLAWRNEVQDDKVNALIAARASEAYEGCLVRVENVQRTRELYSGLIEIEQRNPYRYVSPQTINDRIRLFTAAMPTVPDCGEKP